jgi:hypothetical protein
MIRRRSTPRHSFHSRFAAHDSRSSSAYAQEQPQTQSPHVFTSRFSGCHGVGGLPPFPAISVHAVLKAPPPRPIRPALVTVHSFTLLALFTLSPEGSREGQLSLLELCTFARFWREESALTKNAPITLLESALTKKRGEGLLLLSRFPTRKSVLTNVARKDLSSNPKKGVYPEQPSEARDLSSHATKGSAPNADAKAQHQPGGKASR